MAFKVEEKGENMVKNVVLDVGRVLVEFEPLEHLKRLYDEKIAHDLYEHVFNSKEWIDLDRGTITNNEAIEIISKRYLRNHVEDIMQNWTNIVKPIYGTVQIVRDLKEKNYKLYLLSNFHKEAFIKVFEKHEFFNLFDGRVVSSDVHLLKPEKEIYTKLCDTYAIKPEESVFIDDMMINIQAATKIGFKGICFESSQQLKSHLKNMGVFD